MNKFKEQEIEVTNEIKKLITCSLCTGYFIDATTIKECLHHFCKTCIVKHIQKGNNQCPTCKTPIASSNPLQYLAYDPKIQEITYKLVPSLYKDEKERRLDFYRLKGLPPQEEYPELPTKNNNLSLESRKKTKTNYHRNDQQILVHLKALHPLKDFSVANKISTSANITIGCLKSFISNKTKLKNIKYDILCNGEILGKDHTLMFIKKSRWRNRKNNLILHYRKSKISLNVF